jgi:endoglucanase Acf2
MLFSILSMTISFGLLCPHSVQSVLIPVGVGAYTTDLPAGKLGPANRNNQAAVPKLAPNFTQVPITNAWWSSLIWNFNPENSWSENLFAHPLSFRARATGLEVGYPLSYHVTPFNPMPRGHQVQEYHYPHTRDLTLSVAGLNAADTKVSAYSDWTVNAYWGGNGKTLQATIGSGLPFVYLTPSGGDTIINYPTTNANIWYQQNGVIGLTVNGHHYGIFAPHGSTWKLTTGQLQSSLKGKNYYSVALLPDNKATTLEFFRQHAYAFVTDTKAVWQYDQNTSSLKTTYTVQTVLKESGPNKSNINRPLMALYRHQWLNTNHPMLEFSYQSAKGLMKVIDDHQFTTTLAFNGVVPFLPLAAKNGESSFNQDQLYQYIDSIYKETQPNRWKIDANTDTYWSGKALNRISQLIPIADQVNHTAARDLFLSEVKTELQNWFDGKNNKIFYYDNVWKTLIGYPASYGSDTQLNDHHFHYGYFIMAAALVAHYDPVWASLNQWGGMVELLVKDANNPIRSDTQFPFLRHFDVYTGHSWASGPAAFASGNNQESSSEAIHFSAGLILWGTILNNPVLRDLGIYLYTTEISAIQQYWFDLQNQVFPAKFEANTAGIVWSDGAAYAIWWDGTVQELHGIQFLPMTPAMLYLGGFPDYLKANQDFMLGNNGTNSADTWRDIHMSVKALYDSQGAIQEFNSHENYTPEAGESKAHTYHWIHNIHALGQVDHRITANIPTYQVFNKNGIRTHVAYNPSGKPIHVLFSDGVSLTVPAKSVATEDSNPSEHQFTNGLISNGTVTFWFQPNWDTHFVNVHYQLDNGDLVKVAMTNSNGNWRYTLAEIKPGQVIDYYYSYEDEGATKQTSPNRHVYQSEEPNPDPDDTLVDETEDYRVSIVSIDKGMKIVFAPKQPSTFVDIHYTVNQGNQQNHRMSHVNGKWEQELKDLSDPTSLDFHFTFTKGTAAYDTKDYSHTYQKKVLKN